MPHITIICIFITRCVVTLNNFSTKNSMNIVICNPSAILAYNGIVQCRSDQRIPLVDIIISER